jgi:KUP system potassium uptake protein
LAALGVVFGDIGTSPLYALRECFSGHHPLAPTAANVLGSVSLILWFLLVIVSVKYALFVMRADNKGEGGVLSLMALAHRLGSERIKKASWLAWLGILGAALLFSDGVITPAISVLSAVEGLSVVSPVFAPWVIPLALFVLTVLFIIQSHGTAKVGQLFGPIVAAWFFVLGVLGALSVVGAPEILAAFDPRHAIALLSTLGWGAFSLLGTAFLAVTGAEVLYADMGHFGKAPIRNGWFYLVFPALILNYLGQGAVLLKSKEVPGHLFYALAPSWFLLPLVVLATAATVIASQAVITGAFSLARQAAQLGFWPRLRIVHTSHENIGQVYLPFINFMLYAVIVLLVLGFKESGNLASAYGIAVSATMLITTILVFVLAKSLWKTSLAVIVPIAVFFLLFDGALLAANLSKFLSGGWIVAVFAALISLFMLTWIKGRHVLREKAIAESMPLVDFIADLKNQNIIRVPKTAVFLASNARSVPRAMLHNFKHNGILHATNLIVCVQTDEVPFVKSEQRRHVEDLSCGLHAVTLRFGFMETPNIPFELRAPGVKELLGPQQVSYFLGKESLVVAKNNVMALWRKQVYLFMARNALNASTYFGLPPGRVVELGAQIEF